ncbi:MAG: histidine kinase [Desulfitobacteriaceae bacterium]
MKLSTKISMLTVSIVVTMGLLTILLINYIVTVNLRDSVQDKELSLAKVVANNLANPVLNGNYLTVQRNMEDLKEDRQLVYIFLILPDGRVLHTLPGNISPELVELNRLSPGEGYALKSFLSDEGKVEDVGAYLVDGLPAEVHIGFSEDYVKAVLAKVFKTILGLTALGVALASFAAGWLGKYLSRPIERLTAASRKIASGQLEDRVVITGRNEVAELGESFNRMVDILQDNLLQLRMAEEEQRIKNRELSTLNVVAETVRLELDLKDVLAGALAKITSSMVLVGGWLNIVEAGSLDLPRVITVGVEACQVPCGECEFCGCDQANLERGRCLSEMPLSLNGIIYHVTGTPVFAKGRILGGMYLLSEDPLLKPDLAILQTIGGQLGTIIENGTLWQEVKAREEKVSQLLEKVIQAQEDERKRIARELHDETSQSLAALAMRLKASAGLIKREPGQAEHLLEEAKNEVVRIMKELHNIVYHLRPTLLDDLGLLPALRWLAESREWKIPVEILVHGDQTSGRISAQAETTLFRIGQEAITNAAKYSETTLLSIDFSIRGDVACLSITDNGQGFVWGEKNGLGQVEKKSLGLMGMMERASLIGGQVEIVSQPGQGTQVTAVIPLREGGKLNGENKGAPYRRPHLVPGGSQNAPAK